MLPLEPQPSFDFLKARHKVTFHLGWATAIACFGTLQFGYHLSELNGTQQVLSCNLHKPGPFSDYQETIWYQFGLKQCIPIPDSELSIITTMLTVGGLVSSILLFSHTLSSAVGRKVHCIINSFLFFVGSSMMTMANSLQVLNIGRFLCGLGAGSSLVISPILVNELTPANNRGFLGSFLQLSLAIGILLSQVFSIFFANDQQWRMLFFIAALIGLTQFVLLFTTKESPKWLILNNHDPSEATDILHDLRSNPRTVKHEINHWRRLSMEESSSETRPLLSSSDSVEDDDDEDFVSSSSSGLSLFEFLTSKTYRKELIANIVIMSGNQLCGMNSITFYGVIFLQNVVPKSVNILYLTCALALCNVVSALCVSPLFDRFGRKPLLLFSCLTMSISAFLIALGLINGLDYLTAVSCFVFIAGFSFGIGPVGYLMIPEFSNHTAIAMGQSFGTVVNWISNILIAYFFPMFESVLQGKVFFIFTGINLIYLLSIILFVPETKDLNDYQEVWNRFRYI